MAQETGTVEAPSKKSDRGKLTAAGYAPLTIKDQQAGTVFVSPTAEAGYRRTMLSLRAKVWVYEAGGLSGSGASFLAGFVVIQGSHFGNDQPHSGKTARVGSEWHPRSLYENLNRTGVSHVIVVSGLRCGTG